MAVVRVVEDSAHIAVLWQEALGLEGHVVKITQSDFLDALTADAWEGVDVALIDLHLGTDVSGLDVLRYLREHHPEVKRVVISAVAPLAQVEAGLADVVLTKPTSMDAVVKAVED